MPVHDDASASAVTVPGKRPKTLSYLSRCASVAGVVMSLTATISMSATALVRARKTSRPMRPNPLTPILTVMVSSSVWVIVSTVLTLGLA